jgi:hypothetical protein
MNKSMLDRLMWQQCILRPAVRSIFPKNRWGVNPVRLRNWPWLVVVPSTQAICACETPDCFGLRHASHWRGIKFGVSPCQLQELCEILFHGSGRGDYATDIAQRVKQMKTLASD